MIGHDRNKINIFTVSNSKNYIDKLHKVKNITRFVIRINPLKIRNVITQCHCCQRLGHASLHCQMRARCVKCREGHLTADCTIKKTSTSKCHSVNCGEEHPITYKGCPNYNVAMGVRQRLKTTKPNTTTNPNTHIPKPRITPPTLDLYNFPVLKT